MKRLISDTAQFSFALLNLPPPPRTCASVTGKHAMKRYFVVTILFLFAALSLGPLVASAQSSPLTFKVYASSAPNRHTSENSPAWTAYESWVDRALKYAEGDKTGLGNPGSDPGAFRAISSLTIRELMVSSNPSWLGKANPTGAFANQYGNRMHWVLHVKGNGTVQFKVEDISWKTGVGTDTSAWTFKRALGTKAGYTSAFNKVDCNYGWGYDWGSDNAKGGGDDSKVCSSDGSTDDDLIDELFYVGAGTGRVGDTLYNDPTNYPAFKDYTLQEAMGFYCNYRNTQTGWDWHGVEFSIDASDNTTYTHHEKRKNREHGQELDPTNCRPYPPPKKKAATPVPTPAPVATATQVHTAEILQAQGYQISARYGLRSGVQARRVGTDAIGIQSVIDAGFIDAVDVWGYAEQGVEICIPTNGRTGVLLFLDANTSPKVPQPLVSYYRGDNICASITGPGTVVFVAAWTGAPTPAAAASSSTTLTNCMVTTTALLNFRDGPGGEIIGYVPNTASLTALARTDGWFQVDNNGVTGWISADYVTTQGDCE